MFSVVIPLYNKAHTIERTLQTVLDQVFSDFELIIVDDGSTDNSVSIIHQLTTDSRIRLISQQNAGVSVARNRGILEARKEWIAFLDADDEWLPEYLQSVHHAILAFPGTGMILTGRYSQNIQTGKRTDNTPVGYKNKSGIIEFFHNPHVFAHISATSIKRKLLQPNIDSWGGFVPGQKSNEDFLFLFRVALHTKIAFLGKPLSIYNGGVEGQATSVLGEQKKIDDSILFHNLVFAEWKTIVPKNRAFVIFMKYEIRHIVLLRLRNKDYGFIQTFVDSIQVLYRAFIHPMEWRMYKTKYLKKVAICFILLTKIRWRLRGYPRIN